MADFSFLINSMGGAPSASPMRMSPASRTLHRPENTLVKAKSASQLSRLAMMAATPPRGRPSFDSDSHYLNTLPDPRTPSPGPQPPSTDAQHPHLSNEVAMLSTKLVNAINHQTNLDDSLQQTRHELDSAKRRVAELEVKTKEHARQVALGLLLQKSDVDSTVKALREELAESQKQRDIAEKGRKEMEVELETLTSALFEEANAMVAAARKESEATERKNAQLRSQLNDTELLLASQQEQLADLKNVMERMSSERDETETLPHSSTAPSTPGHDTANKMSGMFDAFPMSPNTPNFGETPPDQPLSFSHLITPVMRNDVQAFVDFAELLKTSRAAAPSHSRASSGVAFSNSSSASSSSAPAPSSSPHMPGSFGSITANSPRETSYSSTLPPLKDNKFYKRCLVEDIEPALRLDLAPGLSWLARRTVVGAITSGSLVVEPFIPQSKFYGNVFACSLCGESRRTEAHTRRHRFRTSEDDNAQRYPLCEYCLGRVRATCDFLGFLRMVRDGLWRANTDEEVNGAWEESVRLREKMFWARLGGGVVPAISARGDSPVTTQRRGPASLSRQDSSTSSNMTGLFMEEGTRNSLDSQTRKLGLPKISSLFNPKLRAPKETAAPTAVLADHDQQAAERHPGGVETADFAPNHDLQPVDSTTSTVESQDQAITNADHDQARLDADQDKELADVDQDKTHAHTDQQTDLTQANADRTETPEIANRDEIPPAATLEEMPAVAIEHEIPTHTTHEQAPATMDGSSTPTLQTPAVYLHDSLTLLKEDKDHKAESVDPASQYTFRQESPTTSIPGAFD